MDPGVQLIQSTNSFAPPRCFIVNCKFFVVISIKQSYFVMFYVLMLEIPELQTHGRRQGNG